MMGASGKTELLIDADAHSIKNIKQAINLLKKEGRDVQATLFASPGRTKNKKWCRLMKDLGISFQPVSRSNDRLSEPNDEAIEKAMRAISARPDEVACIALLTSDTGFLDIISRLQLSDLSIIVLIDENMHAAIRSYSNANMKVFKLQQERRTSCVRAILHNCGDGSVHLAEPYKTFDSEAQGKQVSAFLEKQGFPVGERIFLTQAIAKFWFSNRLGDLTVFPKQLATLAVYDVIEAQGAAAYEHYNGDLAFFLPASGTVRTNKKSLKTYGSAKARSVFGGGGPFMLKDSHDLTASALRRLGYLDDDLNDNLAEAMFCFLNAKANKNTLRRLQALPDSEDGSSTVCEKLRAAFLSHGSPGLWQQMRRDGTLMSRVVDVLKRAHVIDNAEYHPAEVLEAMKMYAENEGLPAMYTFNGLAIRILRRDLRDPDERALIEFHR